jgi:hypothetical protein
MSYDLYFTKPRINQEQFTAYFSSRPNYEVSDQQSVYQNEDTGVYFIFDYNEPGEDDPDSVDSTVSLSINYWRPHIFGLEAAQEISHVIDHFGFSIQDPQSQGMGDGPFSRDGFLSAWNHGNEFGYSAILRGNNSPEHVWTLPGERIEAIWLWNFHRADVQASIGEDRFVPRIFFMIVNRRVVSVAVWPDAISELIPKVDFLYVGRDELATRSIFGTRKKDHILLPFGDIESDLRPYQCADYSLTAYKLPAPTAPESLRSRIRALKSTGTTGEGLAVDQVLNEELVAKFVSP